MASAVLGVDFGTSNTAAMLHRDRAATALLFDGSPLLPSAVFLSPGVGILVGRDAERSAATAPAQYEPNPKRRIDDGTIWLGEQEVPVVDAIGVVLQRVATEAVRVHGALPEETVLTHPAGWGGQRMGVLVEAAGRAGLRGLRLVPEPVAAAAYFATLPGRHLPAGRCVVVYDFGAGTFDVAVVAATGYGYEVLAGNGLTDVGGLDLDAALVSGLRAGTASAREAWGRLDWPESPADRRARRLLWQDARAAKEQLSRHTTAELHIPLAETDWHVTREEFEKLARPMLDRTVAITAATLRDAGVGPEAISGLFLVGGSSRVPLVASLLHRALGIAPTMLEQPELVVAAGAPLAGRTRPGGPNGPGGPGGWSTSPPAAQAHRAPPHAPSHPAQPPTHQPQQPHVPAPAPAAAPIHPAQTPTYPAGPAQTPTYPAGPAQTPTYPPPPGQPATDPWGTAPQPSAGPGNAAPMADPMSTPGYRAAAGQWPPAPTSGGGQGQWPPGPTSGPGGGAGQWPPAPTSAPPAPRAPSGTTAPLAVVGWLVLAVTILCAVLRATSLVSTYSPDYAETWFRYTAGSFVSTLIEVPAAIAICYLLASAGNRMRAGVGMLAAFAALGAAEVVTVLVALADDDSSDWYTQLYPDQYRNTVMIERILLLAAAAIAVGVLRRQPPDPRRRVRLGRGRLIAVGLSAVTGSLAYLTSYLWIPEDPSTSAYILWLWLAALGVALPMFASLSRSAALGAGVLAGWLTTVPPALADLAGRWSSMAAGSGAGSLLFVAANLLVVAILADTWRSEPNRDPVTPTR